MTKNFLAAIPLALGLLGATALTVSGPTQDVDAVSKTPVAKTQQEQADPMVVAALMNR